jgi:riboflavin synthase
MIMFTGIVEEVGRVRNIKKTPLTMEISITCKKVLEGTKLGDSIAVNGVCLTVTELGGDYFTADVMPETVKRTNLHELSLSSPVNLERAVAAGQRMGGHFVQGHVDGIGTIIERTPFENAVLFRVQVDPRLTDYMVEKGSVAVNGISLTIVEVGADFFTVSVIPHTLKETMLDQANLGTKVNVEVDMIGKYIVHHLNKRSSSTSSSLTKKKLQETGFIG